MGRFVNTRRIHQVTNQKKNHSIFTLLQKYDIECYKCNNHGHMEIYCKLMTPTRKTVAINSQDTKHKMYWREREEK